MAVIDYTVGMKDSWYTKSTEGLMMSFSGWRKIFTPLDVHHEYRAGIKVDHTHVQIHDLMMIYYATTAYVHTVAQQLQKAPEHLAIVLGCDTRPSGIALLTTAKIALADLGCTISVIGTVPVPALMAYVHHHADGFMYFTASHNPPHYNGIKFGDATGKVLSVADANAVIETFHTQAQSSSENDFHRVQERIIAQSEGIASSHQSVVSSISPTLLQDVQHIYETRVYSGVFRYLQNAQTSIKEKMKAHTAQRQQSLGIVWDPNGGARTWDFDTQMLQRIGIQVHSINTERGVYNHAIVPEGASLEHASVTLQRLNRTQKGVSNTHWVFAVVCDCDGDRGNIVFSHDDNKTLCLSAQKVFALVLMIELAWERLHHPDAKLAVVVNGASSLVCDSIASRYNARMYRSEVGETNVVELAQKLRLQGYTIPIVGEASNGGNITHPSTVRDPLSTTLSLVKGLLWHKEMRLLPKEHEATPPTLMALARSVPQASTTATEDALAKFQLPALPFSQIVQRMITPLPDAITVFYDVFKTHNVFVHDFVCENKHGIHCVQIDPATVHTQTIRSGSIAIYFLDRNATPVGFVWLRPSATEPVVRLLADVLGDTGGYTHALERDLIKQWRVYLTRVLYE